MVLTPLARTRILTCKNLINNRVRRYADLAPLAEKKEGDISLVFSSLNDSVSNVLPERFSQLKKDLWDDRLIQSWKEVIGELEVKTQEISRLGSEAIPRVPYEDISKGLSSEQVARVKDAGVVVITGAVPKEEALAWKKSIQDYAAANKERVRGFPADNIQVYEFYNTIAQTKARTHPASNPDSEVSLETPISYFDRLRIRLPGDTMFTLGPHCDGGSIERWEDPTYRTCFKNILEGNWRAHDPFDATPRIHAKQDLYNAPNQCSIFRPWQGWLSMSRTGPGEGTLRVFPSLTLSTAYAILRPFFRPKSTSSTSMKAEDWELDLDGTNFPGSGMGKGQEFNEKTHPHLKLDKTMTSVPRVEPGDQVYWHCDGIHAVENVHRGKGDSSVMYIPATPLTTYNAHYLRHQRENFVAGKPAPDFPGGEGESKMTGRGKENHIITRLGRQAYGFEPFDAQSPFLEKANGILFA
ncbi:duf1479 domain protein [Moniliophthora roreri]|uniref:DUF1479-domain-containing protein n=1 Tax=Moniliophthora roreri TaxID=221103 RepID=A0A0W0FBH5_MONRR|nr:duf1479 domain protein [Moniliophthora roreri]